jgi:hypothetical protein
MHVSLYVKCLLYLSDKGKVKRQSNPITALDRPIVLQEVEAPRFHDSRYMKLVRLVAACRPQSHCVAGRNISMENSNDTIGNRTRDLPACSAVP